MDANSQIFSVNPYEDHPSLTQIEADVLWEYAKLNQHIKDVRFVITTPIATAFTRSQLVIQTRTLSKTPDEAMLSRLRILERKMGLLLTLVRNDTLWFSR
jgi:DASH complex subunit DAD3